MTHLCGQTTLRDHLFSCDRIHRCRHVVPSIFFDLCCNLLIEGAKNNFNFFFLDFVNHGQYFVVGKILLPLHLAVLAACS